MSIELMKRALEFITGVYFGEHEGSRADREKLEADLTTAIQQAEAQQPSSKEHLFELWWEAHMPNATQEQAWTAFTAAVASNGVGIAAQQPVTGEPVQADSSEHLRVIASLGAALRRLSFAAQTTGGTDGPDAELQSAIGQAEQALSLGGIWQAMSATPEPVWCVATGERVNGEETYTHHDAYVPLADCFPIYTHPAPSVPGDDFDLICNAIDKADTITMEGDYMLDSDDCIAVVRVMQVLLSVRAAMLAAAQAQKGGA